MGVDVADFDNDGDEDLFMTHLQSEKNTLYINDGKGWFKDNSFEADLATSSLPYTAFGTGFSTTIMMAARICLSPTAR